MHGHPHAAAGLAPLALMWLAMMAAMMAPSAWPWVRAFRRFAGGSHPAGTVATAQFASGYLVAWLGYAVAAEAITFADGRKLQRVRTIDRAIEEQLGQQLASVQKEMSQASSRVTNLQSEVASTEKQLEDLLAGQNVTLIDLPLPGQADPEWTKLIRLRMYKKLLNDTIKRMNEGPYGFCRGCQKPIPLAELEQMPWAEICTDCASKGVEVIAGA